MPESVARANSAAGRGGPETQNLPPEEYARLLRKSVSPTLATAGDATAVARVFAVMYAFIVLQTMLEDAISQAGTPAFEERSARCFALAAQLRKRGVVAAAAALADPASWAPGGVAGTPSAVAELMMDQGITAASLFLATLQQCMLQGVAGEARTSATSLDVALRVGAAAPAASTARGLAAILLSYSAVSPKNKELAVERGAMTWLLEVAGAANTCTLLVRSRALAGAGNIVRGARDAEQISPLLALLLRLLRRHVSRGFGMLRGDDLESQFDVVHNAIFIFGQMAHFVELRPMLESRGVEELLLRLDMHAHREVLQPQLREHLLAIRAVIEQHVLQVLLRPPTLHLGGTPAEGAEDPGALLMRTFGPLHQVEPVLVPMTDRCSACGTAATGGVKLRRCGRCMGARYCDAACQRRHWAVHKTQCSPKTEE